MSRDDRRRIVVLRDGPYVVRSLPLGGRTRVAKFVTAVSRWFWTGVEVDWGQQNGQAAAVLSRDGIVFAVITVNATAPGIDQVMWMMNPAKFTVVSAAG